MPSPVGVAGGWTRDAVFDELDAVFVSALIARSKQDEEEADDSLVVIPWTLRLSQARAASEGMKTIVHSNLEEHPELRKYMAHVEDLEKLLQNMTFSARSKQTTLLQHGFTSAPAAAQPGSADHP